MPYTPERGHLAYLELQGLIEGPFCNVESSVQQLLPGHDPVNQSPSVGVLGGDKVFSRLTRWRIIPN